MKGLIVTNRIKTDFVYIGFDRGDDEIWKGLYDWNRNNPRDEILLIDGVCKIEQFPSIKKYYNYLKSQQNSNEIISLIYLKNNKGEAIPLNNFFLVGYDCGYLVDDEFPVLFSSIRNELFKEVVNESLLPFKNRLNNCGLFETLNDANEFKNARDTAILQHKIDFIETAFDDFCITNIYLYNDDNVRA